MSDPNYTLGRGELHFNKFKPNTKSGIGYRYLGNSPEFSLNVEVESLDHFNSDRGIKEKDASVTLQTTRGGSFTLDDIQLANLALFFFGEDGVLTQTAATGEISNFSEVTPGLRYQLGESDANPTGARNVTNVVVKSTASTPVTYVLGTDYELNVSSGMIEVLVGGAITKGSALKVTFDTQAAVRDLVVSGSQAIEGSLKFVANNPEGQNLDYFFAWVKITPNGDFALKGDEWQVIPFTVEVLTRSGYKAVTITSQPHTA